MTAMSATGFNRAPGSRYENNALTALATAIALHVVIVLLAYAVTPLLTASDEQHVVISLELPVVRLSPALPVRAPIFAHHGGRTSRPIAAPIPVPVDNPSPVPLPEYIPIGSGNPPVDGKLEGDDDGSPGGGGLNADGLNGEPVDLTRPVTAAIEKFPIPVVERIPEYPEIARRIGIQGTVIVKILVDRNGKPQKAEIIRSDSEVFNEPAVKAAMQWLFIPAVMNNNTVAVWMLLPFRFRLEGQ